MDDWPHFEPGPGRSGLAAPSAVLEIWTEELRYAHQHAPGGLVMVTVHPECIGRGHRMAMLERFIDAAAALDGVAFERLDASWPLVGDEARRSGDGSSPTTVATSASAVIDGVNRAGSRRRGTRLGRLATSGASPVTSRPGHGQSRPEATAADDR